MQRAQKRIKRNIETKTRETQPFIIGIGKSYKMSCVSTSFFLEVLFEPKNLLIPP
tara:strand:- start:54 stop:218 length:165 start_codon:yes stop_codon:yes gene_type:complete